MPLAKGFMLFMVSFMVSPLSGQRDHSPVQMIGALKGGTLWIVQPMQEKKIVALSEALAASDPGSKKHERIAKALERTQLERDSFNSNLRQAFIAHYHFSRYGFVPDFKLSHHLDSLQDLGLANQFFLDHATTENGGAALIISDHRRMKLSSPFPYFFRTGRASAIFDVIFRSRDVTWRNLSQVVAKMDVRLQRFYDKFY